MFTKHSLREIPAGKMIKYRHTISKHIIHLLSITNSFFHIWIPKTLHIHLAFSWTPASCSWRQHCPTRAAQTAQEQLFGGAKGEFGLHFIMFIKDKHSRHTGIIILLKRGWWTRFYSCFYCRRVGGWDPVDFPLIDISHFFYHMTGFRYHST